MPINTEYLPSSAIPLLPIGKDNNGSPRNESTLLSTVEKVTHGAESTISINSHCWSDPANCHQDQTELDRMLSVGSDCRLQVEMLNQPSNSISWNGSWKKKGLLGLGLVTGISGLGLLSYHYRRPADDAGGQNGTSTQPDSSATSFRPYMPANETGGSLEESFGKHDLHHDGADSVPRKGRHHLAEPPLISATTPLATEISTNSVASADQKINRLLRRWEYGYLPYGAVNKEHQLSALAGYIFNADEGALYRYQTKRIARIILAANQEYGGMRGEALPVAKAQAVVRRWFLEQIFGMTLENSVVNIIMTETNPDSLTVGNLAERLALPELAKKNYLDKSKLIPDRRRKFELMFHSFMEAEIPMLRPKLLDDIKEMKLDSIEFANLYTGMRILNSLTKNEYSIEEAMRTGHQNWQLAYKEGITEDRLDFTSMPALLTIASHTANSKSTDIPDRVTAINQYLQYRTQFETLQKDLEQKFANYNSAVKEWIGKDPLADKIIDECFKLLPRKSFGYDEPVNGQSTVADYPPRGVILQQILRGYKQKYLNGFITPCEGAPESLDAKYSELTAKVADGFLELDKYLIAIANNNLSTDELDYINSPQALIYLAKARPKMNYIPTFYSGYLSQDKRLQEAMANIDLFFVNRVHETRVYAIKANKNIVDGYRIYRLDQNAYSSPDWLGGVSEHTVTAYSVPADWGVKDFVLRDVVKQSGSGKGTELLVEGLSKKHRNKLYNELYATGDSKSQLQKTWAVLKRFLPLYECIEGIVEKDAETAVPACLMDAISFIPVIGKASSLSARFATSLAQGLMKGTVRFGSKGIGLVSKELIRGVSLPTTKELVTLGKMSISAMDPGFGLISTIGRVSARKIIELMMRDKKTAGLASQLISQNLVQRIKQETSIHGLAFTPPGTELKIPVKIIGELEDGAYVYVKYNPTTGESFGKKFLFNEKEGFVYKFSGKINSLNIETRLAGIQAWDVFKHVKGLDGQLVPHPSGFQTSINSLGEPTGYLFLSRKDGAIPVTELYKDKYYMLGEGSNQVVIRKSQDKNGFELADSAPKAKLKKGEYLEKSWCPSKLRHQRQVNGAGAAPPMLCLMGPLFNNIQLDYIYSVAIPLCPQRINFDVQYRGLYGMDEVTREVIKRKIDANLFFEFDDIHLVQHEVDVTNYERLFSNRDVRITAEDGVFKDTTDLNVAYDASTLTKHEKIALRRWAAIDDESPAYFIDHMPALNQAGINSLNFVLNKKLRIRAPLNEDERNMVRLLDSALNKLPNQIGEFIKLDKYDSINTPWDELIKVGDVVSNNDQYLSVLASNSLTGVLNGFDDAQSLIVYKFEKTYKAKPLMKGAVSLVGEQENLFKRGSTFEVTSIAIAEDRNFATRPNSGQLRADVQKRISVILKEVERPHDGVIKDIYTGKQEIKVGKMRKLDPHFINGQADGTYEVFIPGFPVSINFDIQYRGLTDLLLARNDINACLFFESDAINLSQQSIDATKYERLFSNRDIRLSADDGIFKDTTDLNVPYNANILTKSEKIALRRWAAIDDEPSASFSDNMPALNRAGIESLNLDLNHKLRHRLPLDEDERNMLRLLDSALDKLPNQKGDFVRIAKYDTINTPWDESIRVGDVVSNSDTYMSVTASNTLLKNYDAGVDGKSFVVYRFENTKTSKPLLKGVVSLIDEEENLFKRGSTFEVKSIAIAEDRNFDTRLYSGQLKTEVPKRIAVVLKEVDRPSHGIVVKDIYTGVAEEIEMQ